LDTGQTHFSCLNRFRQLLFVLPVDQKKEEEPDESPAFEKFRKMDNIYCDPGCNPARLRTSSNIHPHIRPSG
jgi:hypothetical protein